MHHFQNIGDVPRSQGDHGDDLLGEHVERIARVVHGFDVAVVHGARDGRAGDQVGAILWKNDRGADRADVVAGAADALHAAGDGRGRFDLHHQVDGAHIDAQLERRGGDQAAQRAEFEAVFDFFALRHGHAAVMRAHKNFPGEIVQRAGNSFRQAAVVDEDERGAMGADQFEQLGMDGAPDRRTHRALRGGAAGQQVEFVEARSCPRPEFRREGRGAWARWRR